MSRDGYDVLDDLHQSGAYVRLNLGNIRIAAPGNLTIDPALIDELKQHKDEVIRILGDIPVGCPVAHICTELGICPREIDHSACTSAAAQESERAA